ncbi:hypothetical protein GJAV_G00121100 [Gymnothorax javanicus]|nr:hypothetical protein GJAV_G00121100 [Gymnothorax javanicus]
MVALQEQGSESRPREGCGDWHLQSSTQGSCHLQPFIQGSHHYANINVIRNAKISEVLYYEYPKLQGLKGSWMFYKAAGRSGQRRLTVVSPQVEGYTTAQLKRASNVVQTTKTVKTRTLTQMLSVSMYNSSADDTDAAMTTKSTSSKDAEACLSISDVNGNTVAPSPPRTAASTSGDWKTVADPKRAVWLFTQEVLNNQNGSEENHFSVDLSKDQEEQDRSYANFYKRRNVEWASPLRCTLEGDAAVGLCVNRHVMSTMKLKLRTVFNSILVSAQPSHVLCGGSIDTATVTIEDCPDLDIRETIQLVLGRSAKQVKQLRKGLKETGIWPLLFNRADVIKLLFPSEKEAEITPQMVLAHFTCPTLNPESDCDDDEDDVFVKAVTRVFRASERSAAVLGALGGPTQGADCEGGKWPSSQGLDML